MLSGIAEGTSEVTGFLASEDCLASLAAMRALGVRIEQPSPTHVLIHGVGLRGLRAAGRALDMGNAGTAMRLFTGLAGGATLRFAADRRRVAHEASHGARGQAAARDGRRRAHPATARRRSTSSGDAGLHGIEYRMPVASAQVKSALLLAALYADGATTVIAPAVTRDHSERMLEELRRTPRYRRACASPCTRRSDLTNQRIDVPGDFSSAAFFIVAGLLGAGGRGIADCKTSGLNPTRTGLLDILRSMGGRYRDRESALQWGGTGGGSVGARVVACAASQVPVELVPLAIDELPVLFIAAACAAGETVVSGRGGAAREGERPDRCHERRPRPAWGSCMACCPTACESRAAARARHSAAGEVDSFGDHRIAMSFAVASLRAAGADLDPRRGQRGDLVSGLRRVGAVGRAWISRESARS